LGRYVPRHRHTEYVSELMNQRTKPASRDLSALRLAGVAPHEVQIPVLTGARRGADLSTRRLGLVPVRILFFEEGSGYQLGRDLLHWSLLDHLNTAPYDPTLCGKACSPTTGTQPTIWVRAFLSPRTALWCACHETRHLWQALQEFQGDGEEDAIEFAWQTVRSILTPSELRQIAKELNFLPDA
jgi:hypothetical protein